MYCVFTFKSGANPYITTTEIRKQEILDKYKNKLHKVNSTRYIVDDLEDKIDLFNFECVEE